MTNTDLKKIEVALCNWTKKIEDSVKYKKQTENCLCLKFFIIKKWKEKVGGNSMPCRFLSKSLRSLNSWTLFIPKPPYVILTSFLPALLIYPFLLYDSVILSYLLLFSLPDIKTLKCVFLSFHLIKNVISLLYFIFAWSCVGNPLVQINITTHDSPSKTKLKRLTIQLVAYKLPYLRVEAFCELEDVLLLKSLMAK